MFPYFQIHLPNTLEPWRSRRNAPWPAPRSSSIEGDGLIQREIAFLKGNNHFSRRQQPPAPVRNYIRHLDRRRSRLVRKSRNKLGSGYVRPNTSSFGACQNPKPRRSPADGCLKASLESLSEAKKLLLGKPRAPNDRDSEVVVIHAVLPLSNMAQSEPAVA